MKQGIRNIVYVFFIAVIIFMIAIINTSCCKAQLGLSKLSILDQIDHDNYKLLKKTSSVILIEDEEGVNLEFFFNQKNICSQVVSTKRSFTIQDWLGYIHTHGYRSTMVDNHYLRDEDSSQAHIINEKERGYGVLMEYSILKRIKKL